MRFRLLGPVEMGTAECPTLLPGPRVIKVLAALLLEPDRVVSVGRLIDVLWDATPPAGAAKVARNCVSLVRTAIAEAQLPATVATATAGYRLTVQGSELD